MNLFNSFTNKHSDVLEGGIFIAIKGQHFDGHLMIDEVLKKNPALIFSETEYPDPRVITVKNTRETYALLCAKKFNFPSRDLIVFGVTGTSGKTTTTTLIESILKEAGHRVGLIGTIENRIDGVKIPSSHTTPDPYELQSILQEMKEKKCTAVVMEVSSHALSQCRVSGVLFDFIGFLNLSPEHLDYHHTMEEYFDAKKLFFTTEWNRSKNLGKKSPKGAIVHSSYGEKLFNECDEKNNLTRIQLPPDLQFKNGECTGTFSGVPIKSKLIGKFNAENISMAVQLSLDAKIPIVAIQNGLLKCSLIPGRLEKVEDPNGGRVILVDYAHKPDALKKVLQTLNELIEKPSKLICVIGCGGDRDRTKRPLMAEIAEKFSDHVFLTSDNPRTEDPEIILNEMEKGIHYPEKVTRESDRKCAIESALTHSKNGDWILIAGKGHETYQIIGTETFPFDDREVVKNFLDC